jgi:hypothetical protein
MQEGKDIYSGSILGASAFRIDPSSTLPLRHGVPSSPSFNCFSLVSNSPEAIFCPTENFSFRLDLRLGGCEMYVYFY